VTAIIAVKENADDVTKDNSVTIVATVSTTATGTTTLARARKQRKSFTLDDFDSDILPQHSSPSRFHKVKDAKDNFLPRENNHLQKHVVSTLQNIALVYQEN